MKKTIYNKIYNDMISRIKSGSLQSDDKLPSTRELSKTYKCHRFTVMNVYQDLVAEGWVESRERSCYLVSKKSPIAFSLSANLKVFKNNLSKVAMPALNSELESRRYRLEFWGGQPDLRLFPMDEFRRCLSNALKRAKPDQLNYGQTNGLPSCLKEVSGYLRKSRNLLAKEVIMTNGSQEALYLIFKTFAKPGDCIAIERKGYPPAWRLFESLGARPIPIEVDPEGLDTDDLKEKLKKHKIKFIYSTPLHQYPSTVTLSPRRRQSLIQIAEQNAIPIIEDDYDHEFHYIGPPPSPLSAETSMGIYVCSFSKILFPGARLGVIACDSSISRNLSYQKYIISKQTNCISQIGLGSWIKDGGFEKHLRKMKRIYESRYHYMHEQLQEIRAIKKMNFLPPTGGMSFWVNLERDSKIIADLAKEKSVFFQHERSMDYLSASGNHLRIGFAGLNFIEIEEGLNILRDLI